MKKVYEAWRDEQNSTITTFAPPEAIEQERAAGEISGKAVFLYRVEADTFEEAMAVHHIKMGWEPFVPMGEAEECPRGCGVTFYPEGSGECPNCGPVC
ncbi:MAG TPA: hypothetical protein VGW12_04930 [Pyrinomonadaceae bacterium]|nr:hypothetical protein [Pyrinomonadaceae bacterium]